MISKKELKMADNTINSLDIVSEILIISASVLLGHFLTLFCNINSLKEITLTQIIFCIISIIIFFGGFYIKRKKSTNINNIIKMYED